jgi:serine/threonine protein kinase
MNSSNRTVDLGSSAHPRVGTRRYMAPELLSGHADITCFDTLKMADIYSFSLVLWELASRYVLSFLVQFDLLLLKFISSF